MHPDTDVELLPNFLMQLCCIPFYPRQRQCHEVDCVLTGLSCRMIAGTPQSEEQPGPYPSLRQLCADCRCRCASCDSALGSPQEGPLHQQHQLGSSRTPDWQQVWPELTRLSRLLMLLCHLRRCQWGRGLEQRQCSHSGLCLAFLVGSHTMSGSVH